MKLTESQLIWLRTYSKVILNELKDSPLRLETVLAAAMLESSLRGQMPGSRLAKAYCNLFGIKASATDPNAVRLQTTEVVKGKPVTTLSYFRSYSTPIESIRDYIKLLNGPRYKSVMDFDTPEQQAEAIAASGYATDPKYAEKLKSYINAIYNSLPDLNKGGLGLLALLFGAGAAYVYKKMS
jgi:flagellum-specific peptidoglycan hydrolase FlgJ